MTNCRRISLALMATSALIAPSLAKAASPAPAFTAIDDHGVDLATVLPFMSMEEGGIGSGPGRVSMQRMWSEGAGWTDNWTGGLFRVTSGSGTKTYVQVAGISDVFTQNGSTYSSDLANGSTLVVQPDSSTIYSGGDGTQIHFPVGASNLQKIGCAGADLNSCKLPDWILRPDGMKFNYIWGTALICVQPGNPFCQQYQTFKRLASVTSSAGYKLSIAYATNNAGSGTEPVDDWFKRTTVTFDNFVAHPSPLPAISYVYGVNTVDVTDPASRTWRFTTNASNQLVGIRRPGSASDNISYTYASGLITASTKDGVANSYGRLDFLGTRTITVTDPLSQTNVIKTDLAVGRPKSFKDGRGFTTSYEYDANARLTKITAPEGNYVQLTYDARGNVTQAKAVSKTPGTPGDIITSASFDATCTNVVKCNKPNSTTDAKGNVTDYTYDATHGGVTSIKLPAPSAGADRPETRVAYTQVTSAQSDLVYMPTGSSACASGVAPVCVGTASETKASAIYNTNLLPTSVSQGDGTGALTATSAMTYDPRGNMLTVDGPLSGAADTTAFIYDAADQQIGIISPDPDGAGSLKNRAIRLTYRSDGQVSRQELGNTNGQSNSDFAAMTVSQAIDIGFDANSRPISSQLSGNVSGTMTAQALTQTSYDALGRVDCSTVRMNPAIYGSLPASACTLGTTGSYGPDRVSQLVYDAADEILQLKVAVGTSDAATERTLTYSNNGMLATLKDGENNLTTYTYDGFDRLSQTQYPISTKGSGISNPGDYEQLGYDANSNVTSRRLRDGGSVSFAYDNLDRLTVLGPPNPEPTSTFGYDNLGRMTSAAKPAFAISLSFTYDALGRKLTETGPRGTLSSAWDLADRRTRLTWPDSFYVDYDYLLTGKMTKVRENGATSGIGVLATYGYDNLGNRTSVTFGNGNTTAYAYDSVSRLASLTQDLAGTSADLTITVNGYNPASQITGVTRSNDLYAFNAYANGSTATVTDGLNRLFTVGGTATSYDANGNLTTDPATGKTYTYYRADNALWTAGSPFTSMTYDPLQRLSQTSTSGAVPLSYQQDGLDTIGLWQIDPVYGPGLLFRYVPGADIDQPVAEYYVPQNRREFVHADERGSVIAISDSSGAMTAWNRYDEYGRPAAGNYGLYGYTGQLSLGYSGLPELYDYKARVYLPRLGIFGQTDPIGMADSANLYPYVLNDPVNLTDPLGFDAVPPLEPPPNNPCPSINGEIVCTASRPKPIPSFCDSFWFLCGGGSVVGPIGGGGGGNLSRVFPGKAKSIRCPAGGRFTLGGQASASGFFLYLGGNVSVDVGVVIPIESLKHLSLRGTQIYGSASFSGLGGFGFFAAAGSSGSAGYSSGPVRSNVSGQHIVAAGAALGAGGEGSISTNGSGGSISGGPRAGAGAYAGYGGRVSATAATPQIGCEP